MLRLFTAISLTENCRTLLINVRQKLQRAGIHASWIPDANLHLSLVFLGNTAEYRLNDVICCMQDAATGCEEFSVSLTGPGFFGSPRSPRIIWAGIKADPALAELRARLNSALRQLDFTTEDRPYHPHITLARIKPQHRKKTSLNYSAAIEAITIPQPCCISVKSFELMQSVLGPQRADYSLLYRQPLDGGKVCIPPI